MSLIGADVDALADVATIDFLHTRLGLEFAVSGDMIAQHNRGDRLGKRKAADEWELAAAETILREESVMSEVTVSIAHPGVMPESPEAVVQWRLDEDAWRTSFTEHIIAAAPSWAESHTSESEGDDERAPFSVVFVGRQCLPEELGSGCIEGWAMFDPTTMQVTHEEPCVSLYLHERREIGSRWTPTELDAVASGLASLAAAAREAGVAS